MRTALSIALWYQFDNKVRFSFWNPFAESFPLSEQELHNQPPSKLIALLASQSDRSLLAFGRDAEKTVAVHPSPVIGKPDYLLFQHPAKGPIPEKFPSLFPQAYALFGERRTFVDTIPFAKTFSFTPRHKQWIFIPETTTDLLPV